MVQARFLRLISDIARSMEDAVFSALDPDFDLAEAAVCPVVFGGVIEQVVILGSGSGLLE